MLFSVYSPPTDPRLDRPPRGPNPLVIVLATCGGCAVLVVIALVVIGIIGYRMAKPYVNIMQSMAGAMPAAEMFLTDLRDHEFSQASALMSPQGRQILTERALTAQAKQFEKKYGPLRSWNTYNSDLGSKHNMDLNQYTLSYRLSYKHGEALARFTFNTQDSASETSRSPNSLAKISRFQLEPYHGSLTDKDNDAGGAPGQPGSPPRVSPPGEFSPPPKAVPPLPTK